MIRKLLGLLGGLLLGLLLAWLVLPLVTLTQGPPCMRLPSGTT